MPKKILYESAIHQFLWAGKRLRERLRTSDPIRAETLADWIATLTFEYPGPGAMQIAWRSPVPGQHVLALKSAKFYTRGDAEAHAQRQARTGLTFTDDRVMEANMAFFDGELRTMLTTAGVFEPAVLQALTSGTVPDARAHERKQD